ncbi:MAG TPA: hypothetical protein VNH38_04555 [Candidatus Dormibacteraeota bacterium]|nr:hypothetical protein [Candidatus Dormibacteraeota bacterium]
MDEPGGTPDHRASRLTGRRLPGQVVIDGTGHGRLAYHPEVDGAVSGGICARLVGPDSEADYASIGS